MTTKVQVLGAFLSFFVIIASGMFFLTGIRMIPVGSTTVTTYYIDLPDTGVLVFSAMISAGLTYFWIQRRK